MKFIKLFFLLLTSIFLFSCSEKEKAIIIWNFDTSDDHFSENEVVKIRDKSSLKSYVTLYKNPLNKKDKIKMIDIELKRRLIKGGFQANKKEIKILKATIEKSLFETGIKIPREKIIFQKESDFNSKKTIFKNFKEFLNAHSKYNDKIAVNSESISLYTKTKEGYSMLEDLIYPYTPLKILYKDIPPKKKDGVWYAVISKNGQKGFVKGSKVKIQKYKNGLDPKSRIKQSISSISHIEWRTKEFKDSIEKGRYNFHYFNPDYKFFIDDSSNLATLMDENNTFDFHFENFQYDKTKFTYYFFKDHLKVSLKDKNTIDVTFTKNSKDYFYTFVRLELNKKEIVKLYKKEMIRRENILNSLFKGKDEISYNSIKYGYLELSRKNKEFFWSDFDKLYPDIIPSFESRKGHLEFNNYINLFYKKYFSNSNGSLITFVFDSGLELNFVYRILAKNTSSLKESLELFYVPKVKDNLMQELGDLKIRFVEEN